MLEVVCFNYVETKSKKASNLSRTAFLHSVCIFLCCKVVLDHRT